MGRGRDQANAYYFDAVAGEWTPYRHPAAGGMRANTNANVSTPAGQALLYGAGWGAIALVLGAGVALWRGWPAGVPVGVALAVALVAAGGFGVWVAVDERRLQWQYAPPDPPEPPAATRESVRFVKVRDRSRPPEPAEIAEEDLEVVGPAQRERQAYSRDLRFFLRSVYGTGDASWRSWAQTTLPSGNTCSRSDWEQWCKALVDCGLAERPYATAPLKIASSYQEALSAFASLL